MVVIVYHKKFEVDCSKCFSTLSFYMNEVREEKYTDYGGGSEICKVITCPSCGHRHVEVDRAIRKKPIR